MSTLLQVLIGLGSAALGTVPFVLHFARRRAELGRGGPRRPAIGSPAQVWLSRGERVRRELGGLLAGRDAWQGVAADADQVVSVLRATASRVAELDHAIALVRDSGRLREARDAQLATMEAAVAGLEQARADLVELIAAAAAPTTVDPDPAGALTSRLAGLRQGLVEVQQLADPEAGSGDGLG